jgi:hypothetical protein
MKTKLFKDLEINEEFYCLQNELLYDTYKSTWIKFKKEKENSAKIIDDDNFGNNGISVAISKDHEVDVVDSYTIREPF